MPASLTPEFLQNLREYAGLSQSTLGESLGLTQSAISRIERGEREISLSKLAMWVKVCGGILSVYVPPKDGGGDAALLSALMTLLPKLEEADRRTLWLLIEGWERSYPEVETPEASIKRKTAMTD